MLDMLCKLKIILLGNSIQKKYKGPCKRKYNNTKKSYQKSKQVKKEREIIFDSKLIQCISEFIEIDLSQILGNGKNFNVNIKELQYD